MNADKLEEILLDPATTFETPDAVLASTTLSNAEKVRVLEAWAAQARAMDLAAGEGMAGGEKSQLRAVHLALAAVATAAEDGDATTGSAERPV